jgi:hypothetical protein
VDAQRASSAREKDGAAAVTEGQQVKQRVEAAYSHAFIFLRIAISSRCVLAMRRVLATTGLAAGVELPAPLPLANHVSERYCSKG